MKRKQARKIRSKKLQEKILWLSNYLEDNKIIIGFHHKKKPFQQLLKNYGEINQTNPNRLLARIDGNGWCRFNEIRNDKGSFGRFLFWMCIIVVILTFIVTGLYLQENGGF